MNWFSRTVVCKSANINPTLINIKSNPSNRNTFQFKQSFKYQFQTQTRFHTKMSANSEVSFLNSQEAKLIDDELMSDEYGWQMEQLMELAGISVATLALKINPLENNKSNKVLIYVGPGSE